MSRVYIIIVNWNGWRDTAECLESLLLLNYPDFRVVLCDNGSTCESLQEIRNWAEQQKLTFVQCLSDESEAGGSLDADPLLTLIRIDENLGFAGGNNAGLRYVMARGDADYCWLLNNDTVVEPDAVTHLVARMQQQPSVGICGSTILMYHDRQRVQALGGGHYCRWIGLPWHYGRFTRWGRRINRERAESWMNYVEGASMLVSRQFLSEVGLMCEDYFLYFEEADWAIRAKGRFNLGYAARSIVYHKVGGSIGTSSNPAKKSYTCDYYSIRNRLLFTRRFYPAAMPTVWLVIVGALLLRICMGKWNRAMMVFRILCGSDDRHHEVMSEYPEKA
ncbi:glycosyltransferase family 2 protein [Geotalea toluenoxydans]|uniref:glycosyltransferase family 2 protein n=1 Tax=Geotalea toluenoxydans TaxID=421624 RepID=UPI0006D1DC24|nr:glycosyltransferase family 2 protein [Geotalea toluenoxydans]